MKSNKSIVVVRTPIFSKAYTQVTCLMSDEELEEAKAERPDLEFEKLQEEVQEAKEATSTVDNGVAKGITVKGMVMPYDIEDQIYEVLDEKKAKNSLLR